MMDIEQIEFEAGTIFARSKNALTIFEARLKTDDCKIRGVLKFPQEIKSMNL